MESPKPYGIIANILEPDHVLRMNAKCWLADGTGGMGWYSFQWIGITHGGRVVQKWAPTHRLHRFRAAWIPAHLDDRIRYIRGPKEQMDTMALEMNQFAEELRAARLLRQQSSLKSSPVGSMLPLFRVTTYLTHTSMVGWKCERTDRIGPLCFS
jgi:hypothetical protein